MKKIISLFQRNYDSDRLVRDEVVPGAEWVIAGEGVATRKWDGSACLMHGGRLYKRYDAKRGKSPPAGFMPAQPEPDPVTGHWPGWLPVGDGPEDKWHREALATPVAYENGRTVIASYNALPDGTYELVGPQVQGNPEGFEQHWLIRHGDDHLPDAPRDFEGLRTYFTTHDIEGIVWWRDPNDPDCDMAKIKAKDFGLKRQEH